MIATTLKPKECQGCGSMFSPRSSFARACSQRCATKVVNADKKAAKADLKRRKEDAQTVTEVKAEAQKEVNAYVRARDRGLPCISCGKPWQPDFQAGHYRSRGAASHLALDVRNIHGQCVQCNLHKHSNAVEYRIRLVERCGVALVEALEADNDPVKLDRRTLRQIKVIYRAKARQLKKEQA